MPFFEADRSDPPSRGDVKKNCARARAREREREREHDATLPCPRGEERERRRRRRRRRRGWVGGWEGATRGANMKLVRRAGKLALVNVIGACRGRNKNGELII